MTMTKYEIRAEIERLEKMLEEPNYETYRNAADAFILDERDPQTPCETPMCEEDEAVICGLIAAWPHMPETRRLKDELAALKGETHDDRIKATLSVMEEMWASKYKPTYLPGIWYDWHGGECPVDDDTIVEVKMGKTKIPENIHGPYQAHVWMPRGSDNWWGGGYSGEYLITAFRIVP